MNFKTLSKALDSQDAHQLLGNGVKLVSTQRQLDNGTISLAGTVRKQAISFKITATGAVMSNDFVVRYVSGTYPLQMYRAGLKTAVELLNKRMM